MHYEHLQILAHLGKDQEALMYLDQSMKIFPTHQACKLRARIFARLKNPEVSGVIEVHV